MRDWMKARRLASVETMSLYALYVAASGSLNDHCTSLEICRLPQSNTYTTNCNPGLETIALQCCELAIESYIGGIHGHHLERLRMEEGECIEQVCQPAGVNLTR
jgi:hypothetical protein